MGELRIVVTIELGGRPLGIEVEPAQEGSNLLVKDIKPGGAVAAWNLINPSTDQVLPGYHVISINGVKGADKMINECKAVAQGRSMVFQGAQKLVMVVKGVAPPHIGMAGVPGSTHIQLQPHTQLALPSTSTSIGMAGMPSSTHIQVRLDMSQGLKLGIDMDHASDPRSIIIKDVKPGGAVMNWNATNPPTQAVQAGDCIVGVNGITGDAKAMVNEGTKCFKEKRLLTLNVETKRQSNQLGLPSSMARPDPQWDPSSASVIYVPFLLHAI